MERLLDSSQNSVGIERLLHQVLVDFFFDFVLTEILNELVHWVVSFNAEQKAGDHGTHKIHHGVNKEESPHVSRDVIVEVSFDISPFQNLNFGFFFIIWINHY